MAFGQGFLQSFDDVFQRNHWFDFEESAQYNHIECFGIVHLVGGIHSINAVNMDILTGRWINDAIAVVDEYTTRFHFAFKLLQRRLVEDNGCVVFAEDR